MPITVLLPSPLRGLTGGAGIVVVEADDVRGVIEALEAVHPGVADRVLDARGEVRPYVHLFVDDRDVRGLQGLDTALPDAATVTVVPAVAGG